MKGLAVVWAMLETKEEPPGELPNCLGLLGSLPAMGLKPNWSWDGVNFPELEENCLGCLGPSLETVGGLNPN